MTEEQIEKELEWVRNQVQHIKRTNDIRKVQKSLDLLAKRYKSLEEKLTNEFDLD
jgi:hypothetical protein